MRIGIALPTDHTQLSAETNSVDTLISQVRSSPPPG